MKIISLPFYDNGHNLHCWKMDVEYFGQHGVPNPIFRQCSNCGQCPTLKVEADKVIAIDKCQYDHGITTITTIDFPSGKIIVNDDLRPIFDWDDTKYATYNSKLGRSQAIQAMAEIGCAFGYVGNTSPNVYDLGNGKYIIAASDAYEDYEYDQQPRLAGPPGVFLANICTDLHAYSIADFELWRMRGGKVEEMARLATIIDVMPGKYEFVHHSEELLFDVDNPGVVFADVTYLGP